MRVCYTYKTKIAVFICITICFIFLHMQFVSPNFETDEAGLVTARTEKLINVSYQINQLQIKVQDISLNFLNRINEENHYRGNHIENGVSSILSGLFHKVVNPDFIILSMTASCLTRRQQLEMLYYIQATDGKKRYAIV